MKLKSLVFIILTARLALVHGGHGGENTEDSNRSFCRDTIHGTWPGMNITCCNSQAVTPGIWTQTQFEECALPSTEKNENYISSLWRIYTCILRNNVPKGQDTISLTKLGEIMISKYPDNIKAKIQTALKEATSSAEKNNKWITSEIKFTDLENIDKIRAAYFTIERKACGSPEGVPPGEENGKDWNTCSEKDEWSNRGGRCCQNITLPIRLSMSPYSMVKNLTESRLKYADKLKLNMTCSYYASSQCDMSLYFLEEKFITVENLLAIKEEDKLSIDDVVGWLTPKYLSQDVLKQLQYFVKSSFKPEKVMKGFPNHFGGDTKIIYGCRLHSRISEMFSRGLEQLCDPTVSATDNYWMGCGGE